MLRLDRKRDILFNYMSRILGFTYRGMYFQNLDLKLFVFNSSSYRFYIHLYCLPNKTKSENIKIYGDKKNMLEDVLYNEFGINRDKVECKYKNNIREVGFTYRFIISKDKLYKILALIKVSN